MNSLVESYQAKYSTKIAGYEIRRSKSDPKLFDVVAVNSEGVILFDFYTDTTFEYAVDAADILNSQL